MSSNGATLQTNGGSAQVVTFPDAPPRHAPSNYCFPISQPVVALDAKTAFQGLTEREQLYAHHLSRASFAGGLIVLLQVRSSQVILLPFFQVKD